MFFKSRLLLSVIIIIFLYSCPALALIKVVTSVEDDACVKMNEDEFTGGAEFICAGTGGYSLGVLYDDNRMSLDVITPDNARYPLELWDKVTHSFYFIESHIEWRMRLSNKKEIPVSMIITIRSNNIDTFPERWRVVVRLGSKFNCITGIYNSKQYDTWEVRYFADDLSSHSCLVL
ncbi:hypothetical protein SNN51_004192 [Cronobacter turicensis]|nr:hypothetical protein [Cronobacter turicensis]